MLQTRSVWLQLSIDVSMPSISAACTIYCVFRTQSMSLMIQPDAGHANHQSLLSLRRDGWVELATLTEPIYHRIIRVSSERPSTVSQQTDSAREVGQDEYGLVRLISTFDNTILRGVNSCSVKGAPPDDDDSVTGYRGCIDVMLRWFMNTQSQWRPVLYEITLHATLLCESLCY